MDPAQAASILGFPRIPEQSWIIADAILLSSAVTAAVVRIGLRIYYFGRLQLDDYLMLISLSALITSFVLAFYCREYIYDQVAMALGIHPIPKDVDVRLSRFLTFLAALNVMQWIAIFLVKISYLIFFRRLVEGVRTMTIVWRATAAFVVVSGIVCMFLPLSTCTDFDESILVICSFESMSSREHTWGIVSAVLDILTDLAVISVPVAVLRRVRLTFPHKVALGSVLCLSIVMILIALIRIGAAFLPNSVTDTVWLTFWQCVEASVAILMVSATGFRSLFGQRNSASRIVRSPSPQAGQDGDGVDLEANKPGIPVNADVEMAQRKHVNDDEMPVCRFSAKVGGRTPIPIPKPALDVDDSDTDLETQLQTHTDTLRAYSSKCALIRANSARSARSARSLRSPLSPLSSLSSQSMTFPRSPHSGPISPNASETDFPRGSMSPVSIGSPVRCRTPDLWKAVGKEEWDPPEGPLPRPPIPPSPPPEARQEARLQLLQRIRVQKAHQVKLLSTSALPPSPFTAHPPTSTAPLPSVAERHGAPWLKGTNSLAHPHNHSNKHIHTQTQTQTPVQHQLPSPAQPSSHFEKHIYRDRSVEIKARSRYKKPDKERPKDKDRESLEPQPLNIRVPSPSVPIKHPARVSSLLGRPECVIPAPVGPLPPLPERQSEESEEDDDRRKVGGKVRAQVDITEEGDAPREVPKRHGTPRQVSWENGDDLSVRVREEEGHDADDDDDDDEDFEEVEEVIRLPSPPLPPIPLPTRDRDRGSYVLDGRYLSRIQRANASSSMRGSLNGVPGAVETEVFEQRFVSMFPRGQFQGGGAKELFKGPEVEEGEGHRSWPG